MAVYLNSYILTPVTPFSPNGIGFCSSEECEEHEKAIGLNDDTRFDDDIDMLAKVIEHSTQHPSRMFALEFCDMDAEEDCLYYIVNAKYYWVRKEYPEFNPKAGRLAL